MSFSRQPCMACVSILKLAKLRWTHKHIVDKGPLQVQAAASQLSHGVQASWQAS